MHGYADDVVASEARGLLALSDQFELELLRAAIRSGETSSVDALVAKLEAMFAADVRHGQELAFTNQNARELELGGFSKPAMSLYEIAWRSVKSSQDSGVRETEQRTYDRAGVRLNLINSSMVIDGKRSDGSKLSWNDYHGKYVVVCFWESWNNGWREEVQGMQATLAKYKDKPIELVTVNLDKPADLKNYLAKHPIDVPVVVGGEPNRSGTDSPVAIRYGVDMLPFTVLVGPDGNVQRIHVFGPHLAVALETVFGNE